MFKEKTSRNWVIGLIIGTVVITSLLIYYASFTKINIRKVRKNAVRIAEDEFNLWNSNGKSKEGDSRTMQRLRDYWNIGSKVNSSDSYYINTAWSGAFISYIMRMAGAKNNFKYSSSHSDYIRDSIKNRKENNQNPFKGYRVDEVEVEEGDLVCYPRQGGVNYDTTSYYTSHCDIVTEIDKRNNQAVSIGGNVSDSVSKTIVPLNNNGRIDKKRDTKSNGGYFVVIKMKNK